MRLSRALALTPFLVLSLAACGGADDGATQAAGGEAASTGPKVGGSAAGAAVFEDAGCGDCHTLSAAGSRGTEGPNLDERAPSFERALERVRNGGGAMPSFADTLSEREMRDVAAYVAEVAGGGDAQPVAAEFEPDETQLDDCTSDVSCYEQAFGNLAFAEGPKEALAVFEAKMGTDEAVEAHCHRVAHVIGAAALARYDGNVGRAFVDGSAACWSGYYHGVLERGFLGVSRDRLAAKARAMCASPDIRRVTFIAYQCVHGLGHGLMIYTGYDLPLSLRICDRLDGAWDQTSCTGGVFMENLSSSYGVKSRWLKDDDLIFPCNAVAERHKLYCYLMVTSRILPAVGYDWKKTSAVCRESERAWVRTCFQSLGRDASGQTRQDAEQIAAICAAAGDMERECVYGAARDVTSNDAHGRRAAELCEAVRASARAYCFSGIGAVLGTLHASLADRRAACAEITTRHLRACVRGAGA